jgi:hypothetical protein
MNWFPPPPLPQANVSPRDPSAGGGHTLTCGNGEGGANADQGTDTTCMVFRILIPSLCLPYKKKVYTMPPSPIPQETKKHFFNFPAENCTPCNKRGMLSSGIPGMHIILYLYIYICVHTGVEGELYKG